MQPAPLNTPANTRKFEGEELVIATHNPGKVKEIGELLQGRDIKLFSAGDLGLDEPIEDGETFAANAEIKALAAAKASGKIALADDSGLSVTALGGMPGIYSARWAGPEKNFLEAMEKVNLAVADFEDRSASFVCALSLAWPDGHVQTVEGRAPGFVIWPPRGDKGFGYDPMFVPQDYDQTFAELDPSVKQRISHRAKAFEALIARYF